MRAHPFAARASGTVILFLAAASCHPGAGVRPRPPSIGQRQIETWSTTMALSMKVTHAAQVVAMQIARSEKTRQHVEVLAANAQAPTRLRVRYEEKFGSSTTEGRNVVERSPLEGHTYEIEAKDGRIEVRSDHPLSAIEEALVVRDYRLLGKPDPFVAAIPDRALSAGEEVPELARALIEEVSRAAPSPGHAPLEVKRASVRVREWRTDRLVFDVEMLFTQSEGPVDVRAELAGTLAVFAADGWPADLELSGPLSVVPSANAAQSDMKVEGVGETRVRFEVVRQ